MSKKYAFKKFLFILCYLLLSIKIFTVHAAPPDPELVLGMDEEEKALFTQCYDQQPYSSCRRLFPVLWEQIENNNKKAFTNAFLNLESPYDRFEFSVFLDKLSTGQNKNTKDINKYIVFASELVELGKLCNCNLPGCSFATHFLQKDKKYQDHLIDLPTQIPEEYRGSFFKFLPNRKKIASFLDWLPKVGEKDHEDFAHFFPEFNSSDIEYFVKALPSIKPEDRQDCILFYKEIYYPEDCQSEDSDLKNYDGYSSNALSYFFTLYPSIDKNNKTAFSRVISGLRGGSSEKSNFDILMDIFREQHNNKECINEHIALVSNLLKEGGVYRCGLNNFAFTCFLQKDETQQNDFICLLKKIPKKHRGIYFNLLPDETTIKAFSKLPPTLNEAQIKDFLQRYPNIKKGDREDFVRFFSEINSKNIGDFIKLLPALTPDDRNDFIVLYKEACLAGEFYKPPCYDDRDKHSDILCNFFQLFPDINKDNRNAFVSIFANLSTNTDNKEALFKILIETFRKKEKNNRRQCLNEHIVSVSNLLKHGEICKERLEEAYFLWFLQKNKQDQENVISLLRKIPKIYRVKLFNLLPKEKEANSFLHWFPKVREEDQKDFVKLFSTTNTQNISDLVDSLPLMEPDARSDFMDTYSRLCLLIVAYQEYNPVDSDSDSDSDSEEKGSPKPRPEVCCTYDMRDSQSEVLSYFFKIYPYIDEVNRGKNIINLFSFLRPDDRIDFCKFLLKIYAEDKNNNRFNDYICSASNLFDRGKFQRFHLNLPFILDFIKRDTTDQDDLIRQLAEIPEQDDRKAFFDSLAKINQENKDVAKSIALCDTAPVSEEIP